MPGAAPEPRPPAAPWVPPPAPLLQGELIITGIVLSVVLASFLLSPSPAGVSLLGIELPSTCLWRSLTGWRCPGCGLTRSFAFMGHGQLREAFRMHLLGPPLFAFTVGFLAWRLAQIGRALWRRRLARGD